MKQSSIAITVERELNTEVNRVDHDHIHVHKSSILQTQAISGHP